MGRNTQQDTQVAHFHGFAPQSKGKSCYSQLPDTHVMPLWQALPQALQLPWSVSMFVHPTPGQQMKFGPPSRSQKAPIRPMPQFAGVPLQTPWSQLLSEGQMKPQPPQFAGSLARSAQGTPRE
jgi:hypothetical protein